MSDRAVAQLTEAILERDQSRTADLFFQMVRREGRSLPDALAAVTKAEAPFVNVPSHINVRDGAISLVNNDHTILGLRTSVALRPFLPSGSELLPQVDETGLRLGTREQALTRVQQRLRKYIPKGRNLSEGLLLERRQEARRVSAK